ncbi:MAG: hydrogenase nickel incorporation protein HypA/HybF [Solirubrobacteraceae bacterium]|jgi:hydrogenase nickel incorporation protein HypA/HybF|nr:hydrogenase nickel incorporation protein HypA/HybF [Solirubrobacteraceae bacterium]
MHELSIAESIAEVAARHAAGRRVVSVEVRVGHLRQVVPDSLEFAFLLVTDGGALEGAELHIRHIPAAGRCRACSWAGEMEGFPLRCACCECLDVELTSGEELLVDALVLEDETALNERTGYGSHL